MQVIGTRLVVLQVDGRQFELRDVLGAAQREAVQLRSDLWIFLEIRHRRKASIARLALGGHAQEGRSRPRG